MISLHERDIRESHTGVPRWSKEIYDWLLKTPNVARKAFEGKTYSYLQAGRTLRSASLPSIRLSLKKS